MKTFIAMVLLSCVLHVPLTQAQELNTVAPSCAKAFEAPAKPPFHKERAKKVAKPKALLRDPKLSFGDNFRAGDFSEGRAYFVVRHMFFPPRIPLGRIIEKVGSNSAVAEITEPASGQIQRIQVHLQEQKNGSFYLTSPHNSLFTGIAMQGRPDIAATFSSLKSERERIFDEDLDIPHTAKEQTLKTEGFGSAYTRQIDELNKWNSLRKQFQETLVNPYKTHIDYLEEYISSYMAYMREGIALLPSAELKTKAQNKLNKLEKRANKAIRNQALTYQWWLKFNMDLSRTIHYEHSEPKLVRTSKAEQDQEAFMEYFPLVIVVPVRDTVGIIALNESGPVGVHPIGLSYRVNTMEGIPNYPPFEFTLHDVLHALLSMRLTVTASYTAHEQFHNRLMELKEDLSAEKRKHVELAYFMLTHESGSGIAFAHESPESMQKRLESILNTETGYNRFTFNGLKKFSDNKEERARQISIVVEDWNQVFSQIQRELLFY